MKSDHTSKQQYYSPSQTVNMDSICVNGNFSIFTKDSFNSHEILQNFLKKNQNEQQQFYQDFQRDYEEISQNFSSFATPISSLKQGQKQLTKEAIQFCPNHSAKLARYHTSSNLENKICSKCALKFALQGEQIQEELNEEEKFRKQQTEQFLQKLKFLVQENEQIQRLLDNKQKELQKHYSLQTKLINNQFKQIQLHLVEFKRELLKKLNNYQQEQQKMFDDLNSTTKSNAHEISIVLNDILKNYDDIVKDIATGPFINILKQYSDKLEITKQTQCNTKEVQFTTIEIDQSIQQQINTNKLMESIFKHQVQHFSLYEPLNFVTTQKKRQTVYQSRDKSSETRVSQDSIHNKHQPFQLSISNILNNVLSDEKDTSLPLNSTQIKNYSNNEDYCQYLIKDETKKEEFQLKSPRQEFNQLFSIKASQFLGENQKRNRDILGSLQTEGNISQLYDDKADEVNVTTAKFNYAKNKQINNRKKYQTPDEQYLLSKVTKTENQENTITHSVSKKLMNYSQQKEKTCHGDKSPLEKNKSYIKQESKQESQNQENQKKQNKLNLQNSNRNANAGAFKILKHFLPQKCKNYTDLFKQTKKPFKQIQIINLNSFNQNNYKSTEQ